MSGRKGLLLFSAVVGLATSYFLYNKLKKNERNNNNNNSNITKYKASFETIDLGKFFDRHNDMDAYKRECVKAADSLHKYGVVILKDPRVFNADNDRFLDMMQNYFENSDGIRDARSELSYQVGVTPEFIGS
jgi:hypothetical protein